MYSPSCERQGCAKIYDELKPVYRMQTNENQKFKDQMFQIKFKLMTLFPSTTASNISVSKLFIFDKNT